MNLWLEVLWHEGRPRLEQAWEEGASGALLRGLPTQPLAELLGEMESLPLPCLLDVDAGTDPDAWLEGIHDWPPGLSLLVWGKPERIAAWRTVVTALPETGEEDGGRLTGRIVPGIRARHKQTSFNMVKERDLSGFSFYAPIQAALEGYEIVLDEVGEETLSHEQRMAKYDLNLWLRRYIAALGHIQPLAFLLHSETAELRGGKGLDIEMSAYCHEKCGVPVIISGGLATVRHVFNYARHGQGLGVLIPSAIYDGSFTLADVREYVASEMQRLEEESGRLSLGVLGGGRLAGEQGHYWQKPKAS